MYRESFLNSRLLNTAANKAAGSGTTGAYAVRVCEEGTRLTTQLDVVFSSRYGSTVTSTYAGTPSAPFLSVTLSLNR